ncbi:MAG: repair protein RecO, repair protein RecO [Parcubacteria group bacterium]|nr:repair protein RecO, repair protein RecO [Parcubacteria group bacterium]
MRHKYTTPGIVLARSPLSEAGMLVTLLTPELGLIRARAEGLRKSGAKLAHALQTLNESELMLVRGKEGWRLTGAVLAQDRFGMLSRSARIRSARVASLLLRLVRGEASDPQLHQLFMEFVCALPGLSPEDEDSAESLIALRLLSALGVDAGSEPPEGYGVDAFSYALENRKDLIVRINRGILASGL